MHMGGDLMRFLVYSASVHGGELLGEAGTLDEAINIGVKKGCDKPDCLCERYTIYDSLLKTSDIEAMFDHKMKMEEDRRIKERRKNMFKK